MGNGIISIEVRRNARIDEGVPSWLVYREREHLSAFDFKRDAIRYARKLAREVLNDGLVAQLKVRHELGQLDVEMVGDASLAA